MRELIRPTLFMIARLGLFLAVVAWAVNQWSGVIVAFGPFSVIGDSHSWSALLTSSNSWVYVLEPLSSPDVFWHRAEVLSRMALDGFELFGMGLSLSSRHVLLKHWLIVSIFIAINITLHFIYRKRPEVQSCENGFDRKRRVGRWIRARFRHEKKASGKNIMPIQPKRHDSFCNVRHWLITVFTVAWRRKFVLQVTVSLATLGCDLHDYVPVVDDDWSPTETEAPLFVGATAVKGVYGNGDVNCDVYEYKCAMETSQEFLCELQEKTKSAGWTLGSNADSVRTYRRVRPPGTYKDWGLIEARISMPDDHSMVRVGFVYDSYSSDPTLPGHSGAAAEFAKERVWPLITPAERE